VQPTQSAAKRARSSEDKDDEGVKPSAKRRRIIESAALVPIHRICGVGADGNVRVILQGGGSSTRIWKRFYDTKTGVIDPCMLAYLQDPNNAIHRSHFLAMISTHVGPDAIKGVHEALSKTAHVELAEVVD
jgi:hypothetical protein